MPESQQALLDCTRSGNISVGSHTCCKVPLVTCCVLEGSGCTAKPGSSCFCVPVPVKCHLKLCKSPDLSDASPIKGRLFGAPHARLKHGKCGTSLNFASQIVASPACPIVSVLQESTEGIRCSFCPAMFCSYEVGSIHRCTCAVAYLSGEGAGHGYKSRVRIIDANHGVYSQAHMRRDAWRGPESFCFCAPEMMQSCKPVFELRGMLGLWHFVGTVISPSHPFLSSQLECCCRALSSALTTPLFTSWMMDDLCLQANEKIE
eukprot:591328-Pelagomonas_calceolata.AAC.3